MRQANFLVLVFLMAFTVTQASSSSQQLAPEVDSTWSTPYEEGASRPKDNQESKHGSCQQMCLAEGEDPLECESFCIQVVDLHVARPESLPM